MSVACPIDVVAVRVRLATLNMSRAKLATSAAINPAMISLIVSGRLIPSTAQALKISRALQLPPEDFFQDQSLAVSTP